MFPVIKYILGPKKIKVMRLVSDEYIYYNISVLFTALNKISSIDMSIVYGHHHSRYLEIKRTVLNTSVSLTQNKTQDSYAYLN